MCSTVLLPTGLAEFLEEEVREVPSFASATAGANYQTVSPEIVLLAGRSSLQNEANILNRARTVGSQLAWQDGALGIAELPRHIPDMVRIASEDVGDVVERSRAPLGDRVVSPLLTDCHREQLDGLWEVVE